MKFLFKKIILRLKLRNTIISRVFFYLNENLKNITIHIILYLTNRFKANFNVILTIFQRYSHSFSLFFQTKPLRKKKGVGVRREMKKNKEIEKIGLRVNLYFFSMGIFNGVYREINEV